MEHERGESETRGALAAAAAVLGIPVVVHDGDAWSVRDGVAHVGLGWATQSGDPDDVVARALLLLWESVREVRVAPARRSRRLALSRARPELEPLLAALDRLLAAAELLAALPNLRLPVVRTLVAAGWANPAELPRHLQWVSLVLDTAAARWASGGAGNAPYRESLAPEVQRELAALDGATGLTSGAVLLALSPDPRRSPIERFERAYGLFAPAYLRLLALDLAGRGPQDGRAGAGASADQDPGADAFDNSVGAGDEQGDDSAGDDGAGDDGAGDDGAGADGAGDDGVDGETDGDEAPGGTATSDDDTEQARAGDRQDGAEGADLFAAEQAGFVETVLSTPLPASGSWAEGMELPELERPDDADRDPDRDRPDRATDLGTPGGGGGAAALSSYRDRVTQHARSIERVRDVWRQIVSERVHLERGFSRTAEPEGDMLDRGSLVRVVADVAAGVERPRAFLRRQRRPKRSRREGSTDYVLLIDRSASMQGPAASAAATAALIMLEALAGVERDIAAEERALGIDLELSLRTALIVFDSTPLTVKPLAGALDDAARVALDAAIHAPQGSTNDAAALRAAAAEFGVGGGPGVDAVSRRRVAILVSDGGTNDAEAAARELARLRALGVTVFGIGITTDDLAARFAPDGMRLDAAEELPAVLERLVTGAGLGR
ncbi:vWA domain-containing protein [Leucobacter aridicollis]|uniref:Mg-chelatase subunit ChlD n=1 Tax=Leucobacter aridicollis TaxID=283878 RepID=A0A852RBW5_9MICO|nr:vWA domain-containing protein [Leucobacter aridicollis]MBL3682094.1 VWA domain-containing protein [Leucobacter aridicollis]NYD26856.1 Mg-chelatase subunit ChlD [Leucobacter aridicollis]